MGPTRRNLVVILTHGLRDDALSDRRAWPLLTPNMDKLGERGARVTAVAATTADPLATITSATGYYPRQLPARQSDQQPGIPALNWIANARRAGHYTVGVGLISPIEAMLDQALPVQPVESMAHRDCAYLRSTRKQGLTAALLHQRRQRRKVGLFEPERLLIDPRDDVDGWILHEAERLLEKMPADRPWTLLVSLTGPANDLPAPTLYSEIAPLNELKLGYTPPDLLALADRVEPDYPRALLQKLSPDRLARIRGDYLGRVSMIDFGVGRLVDVVEQREDRSRTWTMLSGDRGQMLGELGIVGHRGLLPHAWQTPMIVTPPSHLPSVEPARRLYSTIDLAATALEVLQLDPQPNAPGRSLLDLWRSDVRHDAGHREVLIELGDKLALLTREHLVVFRENQLVGFYANEDRLLERNLLLHGQGMSIQDALTRVGPELSRSLLPLRSAPLS